MSECLKEFQINVIGLGYVGLPLAVEFGKKYPTIGVDINEQRINELEDGFDRTLELTSDQIKESRFLKFLNKIPINNSMRQIFIITVPTPIDIYKKPDLKLLLAATKAVGQVLRKNDVVIYESTVFPGCTEEECVPLLEKESKLIFNKDFFCGYSPERINPGDKRHTITKIKKVTSGSTEEIANFIDTLYSSIIEVGTYKAPSIKVAEAAKVIENCQRDINIAFVNELALIFHHMGIDTLSVLEAASSKWNFLQFMPGLVGGHCIGVDPYYLTYKAESFGYHPEVILAGRRINDNMGRYIATEFVKLLMKNSKTSSGKRVLILGITFKENCPDIRNSRVIDIISELTNYGITISVSDPWADEKEVQQEYGLVLDKDVVFNDYDGIIIAVKHSQYSTQNFMDHLLSYSGVLYDVKGVVNGLNTTQRL